jgi:hypothetical protein
MPTFANPTKRNATLILAAAIFVALTACSAPRVDVAEPKKEPVTQAETEKPTPPAPGPVEGSREAPLPFGQQVTVYDTVGGDDLWQITVDAPFDATAAIAAENMFNEVPAPGNVYLAIPVHAVWQGANPVDPWMDWEYGLDVAFVSATGETTENEFLVQPWPSIADISELYQGGTADFTALVEVPAGVAGLVRVTAAQFDYFVGVRP